MQLETFARMLNITESQADRLALAVRKSDEAAEAVASEIGLRTQFHGGQIMFGLSDERRDSSHPGLRRF